MTNQICNNAPELLARPHPASSAEPSTLAVRARLKLYRPALCLLAVVVLAGCTSTRVTGRQRYVNEKLPRPEHIMVYDFTADPAEVPKDSMLADQASAPATPPTAEQAALGRELGAGIAMQLMIAIHEMGLLTVPGGPGMTLRPNDIVIRGYLVSVDEGSATRRMTIGFGSGGSQLTTLIEGYQMTTNGLRRLGSAKMESGSGKGPGASLGAAGLLVTGNPVGLIVGGGVKIYGEASGSAKIEGRAKQTANEIAEQLKVRFQEEGWIQ
jgi:hypothetical protein